MDDPGPFDAVAAKDPHPAQADRLTESPQLPNRNLLRIKVPVTVTLAAKKQAVGRIVDMAPGAILRFDKSSHDLLDLEVGRRRIAQGECVNVGGRWGLRISSLILPGDRSTG